MRVLQTFVFVLLFFASFCQSDTLQVDNNSIRQDSFQLIFDELTVIIEKDSTDFNALIERADLVSGLNDNIYFSKIFGDQEIYHKALRDYSEAIILRPYRYEAYFKRGLLKDRFLLYKEALVDYDEALTYAWAKPDKMRVRVNRARLKAQLGERDVAIKDLEKALLEDRENHALLNTLALIHLEVEEYSKSLKYLNRALEFHPDDPVTFSNIGFVALNKGKFKQAIKIYDEQIEKNPEYSYMYSNRGFAKFQLGEKEEAMEDLNMAIELDPINSFAYKNRAIIYLDLGKDDLACNDLQKAKDLGYTTAYNDEVIKLLFDKCFNINQKPTK